MTTTAQTSVAADVSALLRARNPLLWIVTREEARVERYLFEAAKAAKYIPLMWDVAQGVTDIGGSESRGFSRDPGEMLDIIRQRAGAGRADRCVWIMRTSMHGSSRRSAPSSCASSVIWPATCRARHLTARRPSSS